MKPFYRYLKTHIIDDLETKIVLLSGPRQTGKTTFSKSLFNDFEYLNYDSEDHRGLIDKTIWDRKKELIVLDEVHKKMNWKRWIKGIFDTEGVVPRLLVTGSARLDIVKKMGDSLAGRFFNYRLYPLDMWELAEYKNPNLVLNALKMTGGFPEPFFKGTQGFYNKWKTSHLDLILKQDMIDLENISNIIGVSNLVRLLSERVGSPISYASLGQDLGKDPKTVKRWIEVLENLFVIFLVYPFTGAHHRSIRKEPKVYFFDVARVKDAAAQLENITALSLLKYLHFEQDANGRELELFYLKTKDQKEIDFGLISDKKLKLMIEVKTSDAIPSKNFDLFRQKDQTIQCVQLVENLTKETSYPSLIQVRKLADWLTQIDKNLESFYK